MNVKWLQPPRIYINTTLYPMPTVMFAYHRFQDIHVLNWPIGTTLTEMYLNRGQVHGVEHSQLEKQVS